MKNTHRSVLLLLGMAAFANHSFAQTAEQPKEKVEELKAVQIVKIPVAEIKAPEIDLSKLPKLKPIEIPQLKEVASVVEPDEAEKNGISLEFVGNEIRAIGSVSAACGDLLSLDTKKDEVASKDDEDSDKESVSNDLKGQASRVGARLTFHGNEKIKTLSDCVKLDDDGEKADLSKNSKLHRSVLSDGEIAIAGLLDSSNKVDYDKKFVKSAQYKKMEVQFKKLDCKECNADPSSLRARINELKSINSPLVASLLPKLLEKSVSEAGDRIGSAKNLRSLESIRSDLSDIAELIPSLKISSSEKEKQLGDIAEKFTELMSRNQEITSTDAKASAEQSRSADFMAKTYEALAKLPGMDPDSKDEALAKADGYKKGHERRVEYLSMINANHPEVTKEMKGLSMKEEKLRAAKDDACNQYTQKGYQLVPNPHFSFVACGEAKPKYEEFMASFAPLKQRVDTAQTVNLNLLAQQKVLNGQQQPQWFNQPGPFSNNANNLFTLNPAVFPNAAQLNQNSGIAGQNSVGPNNLYPQQNGFQYGNPQSLNLVYNQAYNNPNFAGGNVGLNTSTLPIAMPIPGVSNNITQAPQQPVNTFQPTFIVN
jgi:hypothetical protein